MKIFTYKDVIESMDKATLNKEVVEFSKIYQQDPKNKSVILNGLMLMHHVYDTTEDPEIKTLAKNFECKLKLSL